MNISELLKVENYKTLFRALQSENPMEIYNNAKKKILQNASGTRIYFELEHVFINNCVIEFEYGHYLDKDEAIYIRGWALNTSSNKILSIIVDNKKHEIAINDKRTDVYEAYKSHPQSLYSGFTFFIPCKKTHKKISFELICSEKPALRGIIFLKKHNNINNLLISREEQYTVYKNLQKNNKNVKNILEKNPLISIVVPTYNTDVTLLKELINSVESQTYKNWELSIFDDCSTSKETIEFLKSITHTKIIVGFGEINENISGATNQAIAQSSGDFVAFLDHDDELSTNALYEYVKLLNIDETIQLFYSDEDKISEQGNYCEPYFKPGFSPDLILSNNYFCHFVMVDRKLGNNIGWLRKGFEGAQDHDFILRCISQKCTIMHVPKILYHWRKVPGSTALEHSEKGYAKRAGLQAVKSFLKESNTPAEVVYGNWAGSYKVNYPIDQSNKISIVIPFKDEVELLKSCVNSILSNTEYETYEILLVSNNSIKSETFEYLNSISQKFYNINYLEYNIEFNYSKINNWAISQIDSEYILLLNNDIEVITQGWLKEMAMHIQRNEVGAVGAKLLFPDNTIQHGGVILGIGGVAGHAFKGLPDHLDHYYMDSVVRNVSACTAACLLVKRELYIKVGGLNEVDLRVGLNDIDLCLKIGKAGFRIIYTPFAKLLHHESKSRGYENTPSKIKRLENEREYMKSTWNDLLKNDPYYNPNLSRTREDYSLNLLTSENIS
ncbi:MAG: glycosyltransferase family 2 protein [Methylococcales bacterium]